MTKSALRSAVQRVMIVGKNVFKVFLCCLSEWEAGIEMDISTMLTEQVMNLLNLRHILQTYKTQQYVTCVENVI
jgi:hypothetical protein